MKKLLPLLLFFSVTQLSAQYWTQLNSGTTNNLRDVYFISAGTGYVVGEDSIMLYTNDYGTTWTRLPDVPSASPGNLNGVWMHGTGKGFCAPQFLLDLPQTSNGGSSWTSASFSGIGNPCYPDGILFTSLNEGFVYGGGCFGGAYIAHWNGSAWDYGHMLDYTTAPSNPYISIRGMDKNPNTNNCVAVGDYGKIFRSSNAFQTWDTISYPDTTDFSAVNYAGGTDFYASSPAIINSIYVSHDDGASFTYDNTFMPTFFYSGFYDIDMEQDGYFGVAVGFSQTTGDGFIQWKRMGSSGWANYEAVDHVLRAVYVVDSTLAYAVGDSGAIYRYSPIPVGLNEAASKSSLKIFPSPLVAGEQLSIDLPAGQSWDVEVFDVQGRKTGHFNQLKGKQQLSMPASPGMYLVKATSGDKTLTAKVLVH
jgi:photosystem II stability/assembly factor-like uncharacterized protein